MCFGVVIADAEVFIDRIAGEVIIPMIATAMKFYWNDIWAI